MARLSPDQFNPHLSFRFRIQFSSLKDIGFYGKAITLPQIDNSPVTVDYGNVQMKIKGKTKWNDVNLTMIAYERMTIDQLWGYLNDLHQDVVNGSDEYGDTYKKDILIQLLGPTDNVVGTWTLIGAFIATLNYGELDWSAEELVQPQMTLAYDWAKYESN